MPTPYEYRLMQWELANQRREGSRARQQSREAERRAAQQAAFDQARSEALSLEYLRQQDQFRRDVENRYLDVLGGRTETRERVLGDLANYGQSQLDDTNARYDSLLRQAEADVYSRGFGGSPGMLLSGRRSVEDARNRSVNRVRDDIINRRVGADVGLSDDIYGFMERRTDVPPDLNQLIQLQRGLGISGPLLSARPGLPATVGGQFGQYGARPFTGGNVFQGGAIPQPALYGAPMGFAQGLGYVPTGSYNPMINAGLRGHSPSDAFYPPPQPDLPLGPGPGYFSQRQAAGDRDLAQRRAMVGIKQARESRGGAPGGALGRERELQNMAILQGLASWGPNQPLNTVPGMIGGPIGSPFLAPSPPMNFFNQRLPATSYWYGRRQA